MTSMTVGSLFSGIGGFDLGLEQAGMQVLWQVEIDSYARKVLTKHWPHVPKYGDIRSIDWGTVPRVDLLCGGFPCQDLSFTGKRAGITGERSGLWSEYVRAIRALQPRYVLVENVPGILTNAYMGRVLGDLAACGYDAEWDCIPASAVGAPHQRDRMWLIAYTNYTGNRASRSGTNCQWKAENAGQQISQLKLSRRDYALANSNGDGNVERLSTAGQRWSQLETDNSGGGERCQDTGQSIDEKIISTTPDRSSWWEVEPELGRVAHGIPHRVDRLRGLGNAVVPAIVKALGKMILEHERNTHAP